MYAQGKKALGQCDRCGFSYKLNNLKYEIVDSKRNGLRVCNECFDVDQPQLKLGDIDTSDNESLYNPRVDTGESNSEHIMSWTYTTLKSAIQDYTQNTESTFVADLATMITQAEQRIIKSVELPNFRKNVTGTLTSGNQYLSSPSDYLYPYSLAVLDGDSNYSYLLNTDVSFIREAYPLTSTTGTPKHYAQFDDDTFIIGPTPSSGFTVELHYFYIPESISASADGTSWLGTNAPEVLLYACLCEAYTFMKGEPDVMINYEKRFQEALQRLTLESDGYNRKDAYRDGQRKINA